MIRRRAQLRAPDARRQNACDWSLDILACKTSIVAEVTPRVLSAADQRKSNCGHGQTRWVHRAQERRDAGLANDLARMAATDVNVRRSKPNDRLR